MNNDGWTGQVSVPRWLLYGVPMILGLLLWWIWRPGPPENFEQCVLRNMRGEQQFMITWAEDLCKDRVHYALRHADPGELPALPNGMTPVPKNQ